MKFITVLKQYISFWLNAEEYKQNKEAKQKLVGTCSSKGGFVCHSGITFIKYFRPGMQ